MFLILGSLFALSIFIALMLLLISIFNLKFIKLHRKKVSLFLALWFLPYLIFIVFFTGPNNSDSYPDPQNSQYLLPWHGGVKRFVAQGNRSFTSHRGLNLYAWDFIMPVGTPVLAARAGTVVHVEVHHDGIQNLANYILIEHSDGVRTGYAHLKKEGAKVNVGDKVQQGQIIGYSGLVGITIMPHLHFYATNKNGTQAIAITFKDVPGGYPKAGHTYTSDNSTP